MSRIWDALREAEQERAACVVPEGVLGLRKKTAERRGSERHAVCVPVWVYGHRTDEEPFYEETHSARVNGTGGLLTIAMSVKRGEKLLLMNQVTQIEQECRVVYVGKRLKGKTEVGIEFTEFRPDFWQVDSLHS